MTTLKLWRRGKVVARRVKHTFRTGHEWHYERDVTPETQTQWLAQYQKDAPEAVFSIAAKEPA